MDPRLTLGALVWAGPVLLGLVFVARGLGWRRASRRPVQRGVVDAEAGPVTIDTHEVRGRVGGWSADAERVAACRPFGLRRADGTVVWVEPGPHVELLWRPQAVIADPTSATRRTRRTTLGPEMSIELDGVITEHAPADGPFRSGVSGVVRPGPWGPLRVARTSLRAEYLRMSHWYLWRVGELAGLVALCHALSSTLWRVDLALLGCTDELADVRAWPRLVVAIAGVLTAAAARPGPRPWSLDAYAAPRT